jgi:hypothetical protein
MLTGGRLGHLWESGTHRLYRLRSNEHIPVTLLRVRHLAHLHALTEYPALHTLHLVEIVPSGDVDDEKIVHALHMNNSAGLFQLTSLLVYLVKLIVWQECYIVFQSFSHLYLKFQFNCKYTHIFLIS